MIRISKNTMPLSAANKTFFRGTWRRSFAVTLVFVTFAALLFWLDSFRAYEAEVSVLVIGKSPTVASDQVIENFAELSKSLSFYERVLSGSDLIDDNFEGYSQDKRKELWNETVSVTRSDKSGVLIVRAKQERAEQAKLLAEETTKTLFAVASFYYNIKTDIDMRIVDEPIVRTVLDHPVRYALTSFGSALALTVLFFGLLGAIPLLFADEKPRASQDFEIGATVPFVIDPKKFVPARPTNLAFESSHEEQEQKEEATPSYEAPEAAHAASDQADERMLPGMDVNELPFQFEETYHEESEEAPLEIFEAEEPIAEVIEEPTVPEKAPLPTGEPTVEEYKRRLNELLSGGR